MGHSPCTAAVTADCRPGSRFESRTPTKGTFTPNHTDRGSVGLTVFAVALAIVVAATVAVGPLVRHLADRQHAQSAADAAALAATLNGCEAASTLASANRAAIVSCIRVSAAGGVGFTAVVKVQVGDASATARATNGP